MMMMVMVMVMMMMMTMMMVAVMMMDGDGDGDGHDDDNDVFLFARPHQQCNISSSLQQEKIAELVKARSRPLDNCIPCDMCHVPVIFVYLICFSGVF